MVKIAFGRRHTLHASAVAAALTVIPYTITLASPLPVLQTELHIAVSKNGLSFEDKGRVLARRASSPDVIMLANGTLLAMFDVADPDDANTTALTVTRSMDGGKTWQRERPIELATGKTAVQRPRHADMVFTPNGGFRIYFTSSPTIGSSGGGRKHGSASMIQSAVSDDGLHYRLDPRTRMTVSKDKDVHPMVAVFDGLVHLYYQADRFGGSKSNARLALAHHLISRGGRRFARVRPARLPNIDFIGSVVTTAHEIHAYVSDKKGIQLLISKDGRDWQRVPDTSFPKGWDPAVTALDDGTYLMVYCVATPEQTQPTDVAIALDDANEGDLYADEWMVFDDTPPEEQLEQGEEVETGTDEQEPVDSEADADGTALTVNDKGPEPTVVDEAEAQPMFDWDNDWDPMTSDGFAPVPDFTVDINYVDWYRNYLLDQPADNAYDAYTEFMPREGFSGDPRFDDMFNSDFDGMPGPWDPEDHPDWEESFESVTGMIDQYEEAGKHEGYASPPNDASYLMAIELPALSPQRTMAKATLAAAWRKENGKVSSDRMLRAWEAVLRASSHLERGATLIEDLVASADRKLVQETARRALQQGVFAQGDLEAALDTLQEFDRRDEEPAQSIRGEHGFAMDTVQQMFSPPSPDGKPQFNRQRFDEIVDMLGSGKEVEDRIAGMTPDDVYATLRAFDTFYHELGRRMNIGYPEVRADDIENLTREYLHTSPLTEVFLPSLSRVHQLRAREEASRRATQLAYAVHIFKNQNGRFPSTLEELGDEYGAELRIDPFSGQNFGYELTENGPRIYSVSENGHSDGGVHNRRWGDDANDAKDGEKPKSDDYVFWPPQEK